LKTQTGTRECRINELAEKRQGIAELEDAGTECKRVGQALRESEGILRLLFNSTNAAVTYFDTEGQYVFVNRQGIGNIGEKAEGIIGKSMFQTLPKAADFHMQRISKIMKEGNGAEFEDSFELPKGKTWFSSDIQPIKDESGNVKGFQIFSKDITERKRMEEQLKELSITDNLTGLYNHRHFYQVLASEQHRTKRYGCSFSLAMLDLDEFKEYNDRFGHASGDAVLKSFANTLQSTLRKTDAAFRYGGDEFTIILPATDTNRARLIIDRLRSKWTRTTEAQYHALETPLGFSAGIAQFPQDAETTDGLVFLADSALYFAKREGGYRAVLVSDLSAIPQDVLSMATLDQENALAVIFYHL